MINFCIFTFKQIVIIECIMFQYFKYLYELIFGKPEEPIFAKPDGYKNVNTSATIKKN